MPVGTLIVVGEMKLSPVKKTIELLPRWPLGGLMEASVGGETRTVKVTGLLVPPAVVTVTLTGPGVILKPILKVPVMTVELVTVEAIILPGQLIVVAPGTKLVPINVNGTFVPCAPVFGVIDVSVGGGGLVTVKFTELLVPAGVVTVILPAPSEALLAMVNVAVIDVGVITVHALGVMPPFTELTLQGEVKLAPVKVTGTVTPREALDGLMELSVGAL
jgi:hypothetical protein